MDFFYWFDLIFVFFLAWKRCFFGGKPEERKFVGLLIRKYKSLVWDDSKSIHTSAGVQYLFWFVVFFLLGGRPVLPQVLSQKIVFFSNFQLFAIIVAKHVKSMLVLLQANIYEIWAQWIRYL